MFSRLDYCNAVLAGLSRYTIAPLQRVQNAAARVVARLGTRNHVTPTFKDRHWPLIEQRIVFKLCLLMHWTSFILSAKLRHCISRHDLTSSSALHQQSTIRTAAHASKVWRTFIFQCRTKSLEQSTVIIARTDGHWYF